MLTSPRSSFAPLVLALAALSQACQSAPQGPPITPDTWAVVNGKAIMRADVDKAYNRTRDPNQTLADEEVLIVKLGLLDEMITQELILARAPGLQVTVADADVDKAFTDARQGLAEDAFRQELARRALSENDMKDSIRRELTVQKVLEADVTAKVTIADQEVTDFFNANKAQFNVPEDSVHLAQILVTPAQDPQIANRTGDDATTPQAAQTKVNGLMQRLQQGSSFTDLAMDYSEDPESAPRGGDMGLVPVSAIRQAPAALRNAVLEMEPGVARVVSDGGALRIMLVVSREAAGQRDLTSPGTKDQITQALKARREQLVRNAYLASLRAEADVTNYLATRLVEGSGKLP
jgi:peptidyl-prolyl cis-trans isomerase SurA